MMNGVAWGLTMSGPIAVLPSGVVIADPDDGHDRDRRGGSEQLPAAEGPDQAVALALDG